MGRDGFLLDGMAGGAGIFHRAGGIFGSFDPASFHPGMVSGQSGEHLRFGFLTAGAGITDRARCGAGGFDPAGLCPIMSQGGKRVCLLGVADGAVIEYGTGSGTGSVRPVGFYPGMVNGKSRDDLRFDFLTAGAGIADRARCGAGGGDPAGLRPIMSQGGKRICLLGVANGAVIEYRTGSGAGSIRPVDFHPGMVSGQGWDGLRSG